ncbi:PKD domain-containing protein [Halorussus pelagicus]|uniref:PKD domain-containing protein n=1 Tax=Halorussus pelagicus TaxID=2505977 RepID=UPI000FFC3D45|nr:PKD domain-containing protein [Halorussus pelagicus]
MVRTAVAVPANDDSATQVGEVRIAERDPIERGIPTMMENTLETGVTVILAVLLVMTPVAGAASAGNADAPSSAGAATDPDHAETTGGVGALAQSTSGATARILNFNQQTGRVESGERVMAEVEVRNTGSTRHTFFVGYGVQGPDGTWYNNDERTGTRVTLNANERDWIAVSWTVEDDAPTGRYDARTAVWEESDRDNLHTRLDDERRYGAFEVVERPNRAPSAEMACTDTEVATDEWVTCSAERSTDPDGSIESYRWDISGQDTEYGDSASHAFQQSGYYEFELTVTDDEGATDTASRSVRVEDANDAPSAEITCRPTDAKVGETVECSAAGSDDPDGALEEFDWRFGDGETGYGEYESHAFDEPGTYSVELEVADGAGATDTASERIYVEEAERRPSIDVMCSADEVKVGETVECSAAGSNDPDGTVEEYEWQFGDGTIEYGARVTHTFEEAGSHTLEVEITDDDGLTDSLSGTIRAEAVEKRPSAEISCRPDEVAPGEPVECSAAGSSDPDGAVEEFDWRFEDGGTDYGERVTHVFDEPGTYAVELEVADGDDLTATATERVTVRETNEKPTADIAYSPRRIERGDTVEFDADGSRDPDGRISEYKWDLGGSVKYGERVQYTVGDTDDDTVELTVIDGDGGSDTATQSLSVRSEPPAAFDFAPEQPGSGQSVSFEAERDARIDRYEWDFDGDGEYEATGRNAARAFDSPGKYSVKLRVVGNSGMANTASKIVTVQQNAYFQLTADRGTVETGNGTAVVMFSASNHVNDESLQVKLELDLPEEGVSIQSVGGESPASRKATNFFKVGAGEDKSFRVRLQVNEPGTYDIGGKAVYYFGGQDDRRDRDIGPITVGTEAAMRDVAAEEDERDSARTDPLDSEGTTPGFGPGVTVAGIVVALWVAAKRRS